MRDSGYLSGGGDGTTRINDPPGDEKNVHVFIEEGVWGSGKEEKEFEEAISRELENVEDPAENIDLDLEPIVRIGPGETSMLRYIGSTDDYEQFLATFKEEAEELGYNRSDLSYSWK